MKHCPICNGLGKVSKKEYKVLTESFENVDATINIVGGDFYLINKQMNKILEKMKKFIIEYKKILRRTSLKEVPLEVHADTLRTKNIIRKISEEE